MNFSAVLVASFSKIDFFTKWFQNRLFDLKLCSADAKARARPRQIDQSIDWCRQPIKMKKNYLLKLATGRCVMTCELRPTIFIQILVFKLRIVMAFWWVFRGLTHPSRDTDPLDKQIQKKKNEGAPHFSNTFSSFVYIFPERPIPGQNHVFSIFPQILGIPFNRVPEHPNTGALL